MKLECSPERRHEIEQPGRRLSALAQPCMKRSNKKSHESTFTTRRGLLLSLYIGAFVAVIFILVYYMYVLPMQKSLE